jgi:hypothetical protein
MRLTPLVAALAMFGASGCVVHSRVPVVTGVAYSDVQYRYFGAHPIPDAWGDGWCFLEHDHVHQYEPERTHYVYRGGVYVYASPTVVWYYGYHPISSGGYCALHGRHSHDYHPGTAFAPDYSWDRGQRVYVYRNPDPRHGASGVTQPGRPPIFTSPPPPPPAYNPPPGHGGIPPGRGGTPPGHNTSGPPPGQINNPGRGEYFPPGQAGTAPGLRAPPPGQVNNPGRDDEGGRGRGNEDRPEADRGARPGWGAPPPVQPAASSPAQSNGKGKDDKGKGKDDKGKDDKGNDGTEKRPRPAPGRGR